jgi:hypothetical protein
MKNTSFFVALLTVIIYEILLRLINPFGVSFTKVGMTFLVWISCYLAISTFLREYRKIKFNLPDPAFYLFAAIIIWNLLSILRSSLDGNQPLTTQFGNNETSLALLTPFCLAFSIEKSNLKTINSFLVGLIVIGLPTYLLFFVSARSGSNNYIYDKAFSVIFYGVFFLIPILPYQLNKAKLIIFLGSIVLSYLAIITEYRIMIVRIPLLYLSIVLVYLYRVFNLKLILYIAILSLSVPFYFLIESVVTDESAFQKYRPQTKNEDLNDDTRTFLYTEVYDDLKKSNQLLIGKGSSGTYYSTYFDKYGGDTSHRLSVEVGILALLLKGGYIAVFLNLSIFIVAIYLALFHTNNYFVISIGFMLIIHILILFITNYIDYTIYNVALWFFVGVCLSKEIRSLDNKEIKNILQNGRIT